MPTASLLRNPGAARGLYGLLSGFRLAYLISLLLTGAGVATEIAVNFVLKDFVDSGFSGTKPLLSLAFAAATVVGLALARGILSFFAGRGSAGVAEGIARAIREGIFDQLQRLPFSWHDRMRTGELIQRATSDVDTVRRFYGDLVPGIARIVFLFALNFAAVAVLDIRLALLSSIVVPAVAAVSVFFFNRIFAAYDTYQATDGKASAVLQENVTGVRVVKAFARQDFETAKYEEANGSRYRSGKKLIFLHSFYWPVSHTLCAAQTLAGWYFAGAMVFDGRLSIGSFVAYTSMLGGLIWPLQNLGRLVSQISTSAVSYGRLGEIALGEIETMGEVGEPEESAEEGQRPRGHLVFEDVWFAYRSDDGETRWALKGISFEALPGQRIALLGPPGSGKTTLVNLIPRFYEPTKGRILLDGKPLADYPKALLRGTVGIVEQQPFLFSMTIRDNIAYGSKRELEDEDVERAASAAAIHDSIRSFPQGYATLVGERGVTLSGGQKQRVAIARTLVKDPAILIFDDSTSAVDAGTEDSIRSALDETVGGRTTFVVAHKVRTLMDADLILVLRDGEIAERGRHGELMENGGFYRRAFDLQTRIEDDLEKELERGRTT